MLETKFFMSFCCTPMRQFKARIAYWMLVIVFGLLCSLSAASADNRDEIIFFFNDALGSAVAAVDESGDLCWSELYTPYGDKTVNDDLVNRTGCGIVGEERGFTGHTEDVNSDLVYMQQRYYDPSIGRFLSIDPLDADPNDPRTYNRYAYANNNPYRYVDPDGRWAEDILLGIPSVGIGVYSLGSNILSGNWGSAAIDLGGIVADAGAILTPGVPGVAGLGLKASRIADAAKAADVTKSGKNFAGKQNREQRLKDLVNDDKVSSADRGWIRQEMNEVAAGKKGHLRNPPGKDLAHERGRENAKGYGYEHSHLQNRQDHRSQHKLDNWGRNNKERPVR